MRIQKLGIRNFRAIKNMVLDNLENALILVGKNSTGKTAVLEAISRILDDPGRRWEKCRRIAPSALSIL